MISTVYATTDQGAVSMAVTVPPTAEDIERLRQVASLPGLVDATWHARPGGLRG